MQTYFNLILVEFRSEEEMQKVFDYFINTETIKQLLWRNCEYHIKDQWINFLSAPS